MLTETQRQHYLDLLNERVYSPVKTAATYGVIAKIAAKLHEDDLIKGLA